MTYQANIFRGYIPRQFEVDVTIPRAYSYNQKRPLKALQRICLWILHKLRCEHTERRVTCESITINVKDVIEMIDAQASAIARQTGRWPSYVVVGREQAFKLMSQNPNRQIELDMSLARGYSSVMGMTLIIAPWFDGVVCLSELGNV